MRQAKDALGSSFRVLALLIGCLLASHYAVSQTSFTRTYQLGSGIEVACCAKGPMSWGFTPVIQDTSLSGNIQITSISVSDNGNILATDPNGVAGTTWELFIGNSSCGFPVGELQGVVNLTTYSCNTQTQLILNTNGVFSAPATGTFAATYNFTTSTFTANDTGQLISGSTATTNLTQGLFVQLLLWGGDQGADLILSNISVTITGTTTGSANSRLIPIDYPGQVSLTEVREINNLGVMAGRYIDTTIHAFTLSSGVFKNIDVPGATETAAWGINDAGDVVGRYFDPAANRDHGFLLHNGTYTTIDPPGTTETFALGINNLEQIVGYYHDSIGHQHGFLLSNGIYTTVDFPGEIASEVIKINDVGTMVGNYIDAALNNHGFRLQNGAFTAIDIPGASFTEVYGINNGGQIAGGYSIGNTPEVGFELSNGVVQTVTLPAAANGLVVEDINDQAQLVGAFFDANGIGHGFVSARGPFLYATNPAGNNLLVIDSAVNLQLAAIPLGSNNGFLAASPDQTQLYVSAGNQVNVIDTASNSVAQTIPVGNDAVGVAFAPSGAFVYAANHADNTVSVIDAVKRTVVATIPAVPLPIDLKVSPNGQSVYVTNQGASGSVTVINTATNSVATVINGLANPFTLSITPDGAFVYVTTGTVSTGSVTVISTATNSIVGTIPVGNGPINVAFSPDGSTAYVDNQTDSTISIINTATQTLVSTIPVGPTGTPGWVVVSPDGSSLYVLDLNAIDQISTTSHSVTGSIPSTGIWLGAALFLSSPPTTQTQTQPLSPTAPNPFNFGTNSFTVQYPAGTTFSGVNMTVAAAQTTQAGFKQGVAGSPFVNASCIVYAGSGGNCVDYQVSCTDANGNVISCPALSTASINVKTSYDTQQSIFNPGFLRRPTGSTQWENIFTEFLAQRVDPTTKGKTKGFSDFVAVDLGASNPQGAATLQMGAPLRAADPRVFNRGSEINVHFQLLSILTPGTYVSDAQAGLSIVMIADAAGNAVSHEKLALPPPAFHYSSTRQSYSRELEFEGYAPGTYALTIYGNAFAAQQVLFTLK
jgi:YVTN family beta-propeller protein